MQILAPTGRSNLSLGQRPQVTSGTSQALKGRTNLGASKDTPLRSPFQGSFQINAFSQGVALGWSWVAPLGLKTCAIIYGVVFRKKSGWFFSSIFAFFVFFCG
jgi:hypothetical protein